MLKVYNHIIFRAIDCTGRGEFNHNFHLDIMLRDMAMAEHWIHNIVGPSCPLRSSCLM